jgi:alkylation response protein AidB-like acyl-CoA dehydrogenase
MNDTNAALQEQREKQVREAEELLFAGPQKMGVAKALFLGRFVSDWVMPYPNLRPDEQPKLAQALTELREFLDNHLDPVAIDREADIPPDVIAGLGRLGILGMTAPVEVGGRGFSQLAYGRMLEEIGARCASTAVFINAHHSIGMRALLLFGTDQQKQRWLPPLVSGEQIAAFALTEPQAGSDAGNVQTQATPTADGSHYVLNGEKRYITNVAIARVLTVMARTPVPGKAETAITAFLVTPDMPGFVVLEPRMEKLGLRGTATARLAFRDMPVPKENILGTIGKGLKVALTVLDFGRTTFGACTTGTAKTCLRLAIAHAKQRKQFGRALADFELVQGKIARMAASIYAMEAMTTVTASLIDRGLEDYMLETAMLKVFTTEALWEIINDAFQIHGGAAYFTDNPLERMLRDARINQIAEGANEVLKSFIALVGVRAPGLQFQELQESLRHPWGEWKKMWVLGLDRVSAAVRPPNIPVHNPQLVSHATDLGRLIRRFNVEVGRALFRHREEVLERQYVQERLACVAIELFASACVLSRWDSEISSSANQPLANGTQHNAADLFLRLSSQRIEQAFGGLHENCDFATSSTAKWVLEHGLPDASL